MKKYAQVHKIAFLGNYVPRQCGIATFTADMCRATAAQHPDVACVAVPVTDREEGYDYPAEVCFEIAEQDLSSYRRAADFLNISNVDVVSLQHEFGIYGGPSGAYILALMRNLRMPVVTTLHTVLENPTAEQRRVMEDLIRYSTRVVVMTHKGLALLRSVYGAQESKVDIIPHGIPDMPFVDPDFYKDELGVAGKSVLLTFGLLSVNKGIEYAIEALPDIVREFPETVYIILGATHPKVLREQGDAYRLNLERLARKNNVQKNVIFYHRFVELEELKAFIGAADIYLTPYLFEAQIVSGTLAYAFGTGKAVVSTPYWHAAELLDEGRGVLTPFRDSAAIAQAVKGLLRDDARRLTMRKDAYKLGRDMIWSNVVQRYRDSFEQARLERGKHIRKWFGIRTLDEQPENLPGWKLEHLFQMTDATGILQHALFNVPNCDHGYCVDDNARALILTMLLDELGQDSPRLRHTTTTYAAFLQHAWNPQLQRFRNFMSFNRHWLEEQGSEDSHGRVVWALGVCVARSRSAALRSFAARLFSMALPPVAEMSSPRAWAFALLGIHEYAQRLSGDRAATELRDLLATRLYAVFTAVASEDWQWFEQRLAYANARLPQVLMLTGADAGRPEWLDAGRNSLAWLMRLQTTKEDYFRPIAAVGRGRGETAPALFDQQPIEALSSVSACLTAFRSTGDSAWFERARMAFDWFLGRNDLGMDLYDPATGGCRDGLHVDRMNENQGAESTLAYMLARAEIQAVGAEMASFVAPEDPPQETA